MHQHLPFTSPLNFLPHKLFLDSLTVADSGRGLYSQCNTFVVHDVGLKAQHSEHHQGGQHGGEEIDERHQDSIEVAVVVALVVTGKGDDAAEAQTQSEEDLRGCLSPHFGLQHDLQLRAEQTRVY